MPGKLVITMTEFKAVVEDFKSEQKKLAEYVLHLDQKMNEGFREMRVGFEKVDARFTKVEADIYSLKEQVALLHEGQTEIKNELKQKVGQAEFGRLEMRVAKLENKAA